jgi:hypothetical protein
MSHQQKDYSFEVVGLALGIGAINAYEKKVKTPSV